MTRTLSDQWLTGLGNSHRAHFEAAKHYERLHLWIGIPAVLSTAILGTAIFAGAELDNAALRIASGVLSVLAVVLTSLQSFLRHAEKAERHKTAAVQIGEVRRELEQKLTFGALDEPTMQDIREKWNAADRQAPTFPPGLYEEVQGLRRADAQYNATQDQSKRERPA